MKEIPLTQGKVAVVDDSDFEAVSQFKWHASKSKSGVWYAARNIRKSDGIRTRQYLPQFLMPGVPMIDHRDGNGLNNLRGNLRPCTHSQNGGNRRPDKNSISKGVSWRADKNKWRALIRFKSKLHHLGYFDLKEDAARAYDVAAKKFHQDFARLNFSSPN